MTISVNITRHKDVRDYDLQVIRRCITKDSKEGEPEHYRVSEDILQTLSPGETAFSESLWDGAEIVLREAKKEDKS
jgi:hypothetical protein